MIQRLSRIKILQKWDADDKVIVCTGARQVGKSTLLKGICEEKGRYLYLNGDDPDVNILLENAGERKLRQIIGDFSIVFIDEAQRIKNVGLISKIIYDQIKGVKLILSGSSALEINNMVNEPLTGRKWEFQLWQISWQEYIDYIGYAETMLQLENRMIFGMYPEIIMNQNSEKENLKHLASSYLYKDILNIQNIRKPEILDKLLFALALQIGNEVNYNELAQLLKIDRKTIEEYISLLEKLYVIFKLPPLSRNERKEISTSRKIYFYDLGIRNAIIDNFSPLTMRQDTGAIWENFIISELKKKISYEHTYYRNYFWRTYQQQEIDYIQEFENQLFAFEIKWNENKKVRFSSTYKSLYPHSLTSLINKSNFVEFLLNK